MLFLEKNQKRLFQNFQMNKLRTKGFHTFTSHFLAMLKKIFLNLLLPNTRHVFKNCGQERTEWDWEDCWASSIVTFLMNESHNWKFNDRCNMKALGKIQGQILKKSFW